MAGGYEIPAFNGIDQMKMDLQSARDRLSELERADGSQVFKTIQKLKALIDDLQTQINNLLAVSVNTGDVNATGHGHFGTDITGASIAVSGAMSAGGTASIGGLVTANAGVSSTDIRNRLLTSSYVAVYADGTGRLGYVPSSLRVKTIVEPYTASLEDWLALDPQVFYYNQDADKTPRVGFIAEWVNEHFPEFVMHDLIDGEEGTHPTGVHYEFMIAGQQSALRQFVAEQRAETDALKARLDALEG